MNITHKAIRSESDTVHGPTSETTVGATWCPICRQWVKPAQPEIDHFLKNGHSEPPVTTVALDHNQMDALVYALRSFQDDQSDYIGGRHYWRDYPDKDDRESKAILFRYVSEVCDLLGQKQLVAQFEELASEADPAEDEFAGLSPAAARYAHAENYLEGE
jgi:hypothetical protein